MLILQKGRSTVDWTERRHQATRWRWKWISPRALEWLAPALCIHFLDLPFRIISYVSQLKVKSTWNRIEFEISVPYKPMKSVVESLVLRSIVASATVQWKTTPVAEVEKLLCFVSCPGGYCGIYSINLAALQKSIGLMIQSTIFKNFEMNLCITVILSEFVDKLLANLPLHSTTFLTGE